MADEYTSKMLELTSKRKKILDDGEALLKAKRIELGIEEYFNIDVLLNPEARIRANEIVKKYLDHLIVEKTFYSEYHRTFLEESVKISYLLSSEERERLLPRTTNGLEENNAIRARINEIKILMATRIQRVIEIFDANEVMDDQQDKTVQLYSDQDIEEFDNIMNEIERLDKEATNLVLLQKKRNFSGQKFIARFLNFLQKF